jgi:hypothetical protein
VLNSDSPTLPTSLLVETAEVLSHPGDRAVLGPSTDGGYYLLGLKARHRRLFEEITWSTDLVAEQTLARAAEIGLSVHLLPAWYDVDDAQSLSVLYGELFEDRPFSRRHDRHRAASSASLMRTLLARSTSPPASILFPVPPSPSPPVERWQRWSARVTARKETAPCKNHPRPKLPSTRAATSKA